MFSKISACDKWCSSSDDHIHGDGDIKKSKCAVGVDTIFHARTNENDSTIPVGKCVLLTKSAKDTSKCKYLYVGDKHLELKDDTSKKVDFNEQNKYVLEASPIADGIITIIANGGKYLQAESSFHHIKAESNDECDSRSHFFVEEVASNDQCENQGDLDVLFHPKYEYILYDI